ncbi:hypothetical protein [Streptantibioticus ferralitis]|uniref:Uncharacterized protein n=1 Tax=Streptantibioticus ferralitis TaxID=236510 RepID=A0ABT5ZAN8_9ACTN|nr:hypothetical protein [Streptantibioticus ferralitis]MDF2260905.1 hypothetical protein [Streptantibioticus ferralitis]
MSAPRRTPAARTASALASPALTNAIGLIGIVTPIVAWANSGRGVKNILLVAETVIVLVLVATHIWLRRRFITLRRANNLNAMDDAHYYDLIRAQLESDLVAEYGEIADGHLRVYSSEVPRLSVMLVKTLISSQSEPQRILAADLTTDPSLLTRRREYLAANRQFIESGGTISRLFIAHAADLAREDYTRDLLQLISHHRELGVTCGLAVRDRLRAEQAVDYIVFAGAAVLVEEEQGDADFTKGRSSVYFKGVDRWSQRFESVWGQGADSAPLVLQKYETLARPMLDADTWDSDRVKEGVDAL